MATDTSTAFSESIKDVLMQFKVTGPDGTVYINHGSPIPSYTLPIAGYTITPILSTLPDIIKLSNTKILWEYGDGSFGEGLEVTKWYKYPGEYEIKCTMLDSMGSPHMSTFGQKVIVRNYLPDDIVWSTKRANAKQPEYVKASDNSNRLELLRLNSWQTYETLSARGYYINLYSKGSKSKAVTDTAYTTDKNIHFTPTWRIVDTSSSKTPVTKVLTTSNKVYVKYSGSELVHTCAGEPGSAFAGTSGIGDFYYIDDMPSSYSSQDKEPVFLFAGFENSRFVIQSGDDNISDYKKIYLNFFETTRSVLPLQVKFNVPTKLTVTANGIKDFNINSKKFEHNYITFSITLADSEGNYIKNDFPTLSADHEVPIGNRSDAYTVNVSTSSSEVLTSSDIVANNTFKFTTLGAYNGFLRVCGSSEDVFIRCDTKILPPAHFDSDVLNYYIATSPTTTFWQLKPTYYADFAYDAYEGVDELALTTIDPISTVTPTSSGLLGFAVDSEGSVWMADGDNDQLLQYDLNRSPLTALDLRHYVTDDFPLDYEDSITPSSIAVDSEDNIWVTLFDAVSTLKLSKTAPHSVLASAVPDMSPVHTPWVSGSNGVDVSQGNYITTYYNQSVHNNDIALQSENRGSRTNRLDNENDNPYLHPNVKYEQLFNPTQVATDSKDNVWVTYSNPLCSMVVKYNSTGTELGRYEFDNETMPTDITIDCFEHAWVVCLNNPNDSRPRAGKIARLRENCTLMYEISSIADSNFHTLDFDTPDEISLFNFGIYQALSGWVANHDDGTHILNLTGGRINPEVNFIRGHQYTFKNAASSVYTMQFALTSNPTGTYTDGVVDTQVTDGVIVFTVPHDAPDHLYYKDAIDDTTRGTMYITTSANPRLDSTYDEIYMPGAITTDFDNHAWFTHGRNLVSRIHKGDADNPTPVAPTVTDTFHVGATFADPLYNTNPPISWYYSRANQALEGISTDTANNILVINNADTRLYIFNASTTALNTGAPLATSIGSLSSYVDISDVSKASTQIPAQWELQQTDPGHMPTDIRASGDWTGWRRIVNYDYHGNYGTEEYQEVEYPALSGASNTFEIISMTGYNRIMKNNEDHDFSETLRSYIFQDTLDSNKNFTEWLLPSLGDSTSEPEIFGRKIFEKIANFSPNHADMDTGTIDSLYSFADMVGYDMDNYRLPYPPNIKRLVDLLSIKQSKLFGGRDNIDDSFDKMGFECNPDYGANLGDLIDTTTYTLTASTPIVLRELFNSNYSKIVPGIAHIDSVASPGFTSGDPVSSHSLSAHYSTTYDGLTSYPLNSYEQSWGWGLHGADWAELSKYYEFYSYVSTGQQKQVHGIIDWDNTMTTIKETASGNAEWIEKDGVVDMAFDYKLRQGLGLFDTTDPNYTGDEDRIINIKNI